MITLKQQLFLDRLLGLPTVYVLNMAARILGFFLRINHSLERPVKTIVVCKFMGIGSIIQTTPFLQTLKRNYPEARIVFVSLKANKEILECITLIDQLILLDCSSVPVVIGSTFTVLRQLWCRKINLYFDLELYSNYSTAIATMSFAINRFGYYRRSNHLLLGIYTHMMYFNCNTPIALVYNQMARLAGCKNTVDTLLKVYTSNNKDAFTKSFDTREDYIIINVNASSFALERRWGKEKFTALILLIGDAFENLKIYLTGTEDEEPYVATICQEVETPQVINLAGKLTLKEFAQLVEHSQLVISNDSGPMHLSLSLKKTTIGLFGPASPLQYGTLDHLHVFYERVYCSPCLHNFDTPPCQGDNQCMQRIVVADVFRKTKEILLNHLARIDSPHYETHYTKIGSSEPLGNIKRLE